MTVFENSSILFIRIKVHILVSSVYCLLDEELLLLDEETLNTDSKQLASVSLVNKILFAHELHAIMKRGELILFLAISFSMWKYILAPFREKIDTRRSL